jgi:hypothetical protein
MWRTSIIRGSRSRGRAARNRIATPKLHPVIVVGAGLVGLATATDLAEKNVDAVLLDWQPPRHRLRVNFF